jgi:hypothetical protein
VEWAGGKDCHDWDVDGAAVDDLCEWLFGRVREVSC